MPDPTEPAKAPAGIVITPGVDDVIAALERQIDHVEYQQRFFEGVQLSSEDLEFHRRLWYQIIPRVNEVLGGQCWITGGHPELNGFGARLLGTDSDGREYTAEFHYDDELRMANSRLDAEPLVRECIDLIAGAMLGERAKYMHRMTGSTEGRA